MFHGVDLTVEEKSRRDELSKRLAAAGIPMREDSALIREHVFFGSKTPETIVQKLCEARYLHEYCDFHAGYQLAKNSAAGHMPRTQWLEHVQHCVLAQTKTGVFPDKWPWQT